MKILSWIAFVFFSLAIGFYPFMYLLVDMSAGFLASKGDLLHDKLWNFAFYQHILFGAIAMLTGWSQFSKRMRSKSLNIHRTLGKTYIIVVLLSGTAGFYLAMFANGGLIANLGFSGLALGWLTTTILAYLYIRRKHFDEHQYWMIRSYAFCWAAVTLRIWIPVFQMTTDLEFITAYKIISWLCWVPNIVVAEAIIQSLKSKTLRQKQTAVA
jgi:hypothetical protein